MPVVQPISHDRKEYEDNFKIVVYILATFEKCQISERREETIKFEEEPRSLITGVLKLLGYVQSVLGSCSMAQMCSPTTLSVSMLLPLILLCPFYIL